MNYVTDESRPDLGGNMRHGDAWTWTPALWSHLIDRFAVRSVLDVGCGEGHAVRYFQRQGVAAHGIDGLMTNVERAVTPIACHDLLHGPYVMPVDLVWSCEVAEHIMEAGVGLRNYLDTLANGRIIAMTHATPGQGGHHHVNCQRPEYWIERMGIRGYRVVDGNVGLRMLAIEPWHNGWSHFGRTGLVFVKD